MKALVFLVSVLIMGLCLLTAVSATANDYLESRGLATMTPFAGWPTATPGTVWP